MNCWRKSSTRPRCRWYLCVNIAVSASTPERILQRLDWQVVRRLDGQLQGDYRSLFYGYGIDFADLREYQPEDDIRYIDWNVTARMNTPYVRQYIEDREISAWFLLDLRPSLPSGRRAFRIWRRCWNQVYEPSRSARWYSSSPILYALRAGIDRSLCSITGTRFSLSACGIAVKPSSRMSVRSSWKTRRRGNNSTSTPGTSASAAGSARAPSGGRRGSTPPSSEPASRRCRSRLKKPS